VGSRGEYIMNSSNSLLGPGCGAISLSLSGGGVGAAEGREDIVERGVEAAEVEVEAEEAAPRPSESDGPDGFNFHVTWHCSCGKGVLIRPREPRIDVSSISESFLGVQALDPQ
jgi:hypothetical protein